MTEVTIGQFKKFVEATKYITEAEQFGFGNSGATTPDDEDHAGNEADDLARAGYAVTDDSPVTQVTWNDAVQVLQLALRARKVETLLPAGCQGRLDTVAIRHGLPAADRSGMGICLPRRHDHAVFVWRRPGHAGNLRLVSRRTRAAAPGP